MDEQERLRLEVDHAAQRLRDLTETRIRLLALVPSLAGAVVAFVSASSTGADLIAIALLGLAATGGILVYELRNSELRAAAAARLDALLPALAEPAPARAAVSHATALALVYGAALGGWGYLLAWGALKAGGVAHARPLGVAVGAVAGVLVAGLVDRAEERLAARPAPAVG